MCKLLYLLAVKYIHFSTNFNGSFFGWELIALFLIFCWFHPRLLLFYSLIFLFLFFHLILIIFLVLLWYLFQESLPVLRVHRRPASLLLLILLERCQRLVLYVWIYCTHARISIWNTTRLHLSGTGRSLHLRLSTLRFRSYLAVDGQDFVRIARESLVDSLCLQLVVELLNDIISLDHFDLGSRVNLDEFFNRQESSPDANQDLVTVLNLDMDLALTELVDAFRLSQEQDLHFFALWELIQEIGQSHIDPVELMRNIKTQALL